MELHRLADGRFLCHQSFGDPQGLPLIYCHGWSASRLEASLIELLAVRLIAIDRPGYGGSTPCHGRTLLDWAADVQSLLDALGLTRVGIVGVSGGGPYALACARALPQRIAAVGLISPVPPARGPYLGNCPLEALYRIGRSPLLGHAVLAPARWLLLRQWLGPGLFFGLSSLPPADRAALTAARADLLLASCREGLRQGIGGPLSDARIYAAPWGFALSDVAVPVRIWHGESDSVVPARALAAWVAAESVPFEWMPGQGHFSVAIEHHAAVIDWLSQQAGSVP